MTKKLVLTIWLIIIGLLINSFHSQAQFHIGPEIGTAISAIVPSDQDIPEYAQRISARVGFFGEAELIELFSLRSGIFYSLRGFNFGTTPNTYNNSKFWDLHCIVIPLMAVFKPSEKVQLALGVEFNSVVNSNLPLIQTPSLLIGIRGECGFHVTNQLRVAAYYTHTINRLLEIPASNGKKDGFYNNILAGISMSYVLKSFPNSKNQVEETCPPYL